MNPILRRAIHAIYMDAADDKGGGGAAAGGGGDKGDKGGGDGTPKFDPAAARTVLTEYGHSAEALKGMKDEDVEKLHKAVSSTSEKQTKAALEKAKNESSVAVKANQEKWTKGELKLELPKDSKLDQKDVDEVAAIARERGLSAEQATEILQQRQTAVTAFEARETAKFKAERVKWVDEIKNDPELGGDKLAETQRLSMLPIEKFMQPELRTWLRETGFGDSPMLVRFLTKIGRAMAEDKPGASGGLGGSGGKKSAEEVLYGEPQK